MGHIRAFTQKPSCWMHCAELLIAFCICVAMTGCTKTGPAANIMFAVGPGVLHLSDIHSWQLSGKP